MKNLNELMKVELSEKEPCLTKADVTIPADAVSNEVDLAVKEFSKHARLPGFRAGKAPKHLIKKRYASDLKKELTRKFQLAAFDKIREISPTDIVSLPIPDGKFPEPVTGEDLVFSLTMNVAPAIKLPKYSGIKLKKVTSQVAKKEIDAEVDRIREMYAEFVTVDEAAKEGDMLKITYTSDLDAPEDASVSYKRCVSAEDSWCWLSEPEMLPGIIKALKGAKKGTGKKMDVIFPENFTEPELVGKEAKFDIKVAEVQRKMPITSDEEFCKRISIPDIKTFREQLEKNLQSHAQMEADSQLQQAAIEIVCDGVKKLDLPPDMLAQSVQREFRAIANDLVKSEGDVENFKKETEKHQKDAEKTARQRLTRYFICKKIADEEGITVEQKDIDERISAMSKAYGYKEKDLRKQLESTGGVDEIHLDITVSKAIEFIMKNADIADSAKEKSDKKSENAEPDNSKKNSEKIVSKINGE